MFNFIKKDTSSVFTIRFTVITAFLMAVCLTAAVTLWMQYYFSRGIAVEAAGNQFKDIAGKISERAQQLDFASASLSQMLTLYQELSTPITAENSHSLVPIMARALSANPFVYSLYVGYPNGNALHLLNLDNDPLIRSAIHAAPEDKWAVLKIMIKGGSRVQITEYYNSALDMRFSIEEDSHYDPRSRPWYKMAMQDVSVIKTPPYMFNFLKSPGVTYAKKTPSGEVVGVDISLKGMADFIKSQALPEKSDAFIFNEKGEVRIYRNIISAQIERKSEKISLTESERIFVERAPVIRVSNELDYPPFDFSVSGAPKGYSIDYLKLLGEKTGLKFEFVNGLSFVKLLNLFKEKNIDMMHSVHISEDRLGYSIFSDPFVKSNIVAIYRKMDKPFTSMSQLANMRVALPMGFALSDFVKEHYSIESMAPVSGTLEGLRAIQEGKADIMFEDESVARYLIEHYFLNHLKVSKNIPELDPLGYHQLHFMLHPENVQLLNILNKALSLITDDEKEVLASEWLNRRDEGASNTNRENLASGGLPHKQLLPLALKGLPKITELEIGGQMHLAYTQQLNSIYGEREYLGMTIPIQVIIEPYMKTIMYSLLITGLAIILFLPFIFYLAQIIVKPIKLLIGENNKVQNQKFEQVNKVPSIIKEIDQLSSSMVYMANSIKDYQMAQKNLLDAIIKLLAQAIDDKSPYTGGHCERVPVLAVMLAEQAGKSQRSSFKGFEFTTEEQWREFKTAAWLHDCGKVTTPEHIVDKGSKLEAIYNRIHEVRMRFEVLLRDSEITYLQEVIKNPEDYTILKNNLTRVQSNIKSDFEFVAKCNVGGEFMEKESIVRLKLIADQSWTRNLDDQLGLSPEESRKGVMNSTPVPCEEALLSDKESHITERQSMTMRDEKYGFDMPVPKYKQNLGELYNLSIVRGTLTEEDRYIINEHIVTTIQMLETLPLPPELARVPEYAGAHHETLIGTGYPRKLKEEQLSIPARIMAIADIFEALTASDRPYKEGKTLSQALNILHFMSKDKHIDKNLFELFIETRVYLKYAEKYMASDKIDKVDTHKYIDGEGSENNTSAGVSV